MSSQNSTSEPGWGLRRWHVLCDTPLPFVELPVICGVNSHGTFLVSSADTKKNSVFQSLLDCSDRDAHAIVISLAQLTRRHQSSSQLRQSQLKSASELCSGNPAGYGFQVSLLTGGDGHKLRLEASSQLKRFTIRQVRRVAES